MWNCLEGNSFFKTQIQHDCSGECTPTSWSEAFFSGTNHPCSSLNEVHATLGAAALLPLARQEDCISPHVLRNQFSDTDALERISSTSSVSP